MNCVICESYKGDNNYLFLYETKFWNIKLAKNQSLLGRCVVSLKRHAGDLAALTDKEMLDFKKVVAELETAIRKAFSPQNFNWSCLMNHAFREEPYNPHVHWWAVPRYDKTVIFEDQKFEDKLFGNPYDHCDIKEFSLKIRKKIAEEIKKNLPKS